MPNQDALLARGFEYAKEVYAAHGVDVETAMARCAAIPVSMHCWQGDDVVGCEGEGGGASGGIATTGNYPGRARNAAELRQDIDLALSLIPGAKKLNLHASYAELGGRKLDRDAYTADQFRNWIDWAKDKGMGLDFNPSCFSHPYARDGFTLSSADPKIQCFWIEHAKRCREIAEVFAKELGKPCVVNHWMPDGYKDTPADTVSPRRRMIEALDAIFAETAQVDNTLVLDAVESKLFGIGVESYTVGSHELMMNYAVTRNKLYTLDAGHFHPLEYIADKISSVMLYMPKMLLHISRSVRWDSDHVVTLDDQLERIMNEIIWNDFADRVYIALDYFDASINRVAAWAIGMRNAQKALLKALLAPKDALVSAEHAGDYTGRLALMEENKTLPFGPVFDLYCARQNVPVGAEWLEIVRAYERNTLSGRV